MRAFRPVLPPLAVLAFLALPAGDAAAQFRRSSPPTPTPERQREAPPALPGLQGRTAPEPIPADPDQNLGPNEALFDAINRGDIAAARDAVSRGADLGARNILGLTPLDSAVDQGRTEIMFYLLSVRGGTRGGSSPPPEAEPAPPPSQTARRASPPRAAPLAPAAAQAAARTPRLWAGDGGSPIPDIGFLGFDAGRPTGGTPPEPQRESRSSRSRGRG